MITERLKELNLPDVLKLEDGRIACNAELWKQRRKEIIEILSREVYGFSPPPPAKVTCETMESNDDAFAGKAVHYKFNLGFETPGGWFSFPLDLILPKSTEPVPLFLYIAFRPNIPDRLFPTEEIIDGGFGTALFYYQDIAADLEDGFAKGLPAMYSKGERTPREWGKISMWAWAASRVMDYLQERDDVDRERIAVIGHSRLGKTALWCAAQDERFAAAISNESGCSGAAITREKSGEQIRDIIKNFRYWFCENYRKYVDNEKNMPFDQHFLLAAIAPRLVYVSSAQEDQWADPNSEFLACAAADRVYKLLGCKGFIANNEFPVPGTTLHKGDIGYHLREGTHFLSRYDWQRFMEFITNKFK